MNKFTKKIISFFILTLLVTSGIFGVRETKSAINDDFAYNAENALRWSFLSHKGESPDAPQASLIDLNIDDDKNLVKF